MRCWRGPAAAVVALGLLAGCAGSGSPPPGGPSSGGTSNPRPSATATATPSPTPTSTPTPSPVRPAVGHSAWVAVSVATLWRSPTSPRAVDEPALRTPAAIRQWLAGLTDAGRHGLVGRADTQALLGDRVVVTALRGRFAQVVVPDQPTPLDRRGYPGWLPVAQLSGSAPPSTARVATVVSRTAWLRADEDGGRHVLEASFGTRLPVLGQVPDEVRVGLPAGRVLRVPTSRVSVTRAGAPALPTDGEALVHSATAFIGLPYLWAGRSGFGVDCSGLTSLVLRVHGVVAPRDAAPQASAGVAVRATDRRPGDLLFYAARGEVHHVTMDVGHGRMVHAPSTGHRVETIPVATAPLADEYVGARRFVP